MKKTFNIPKENLNFAKLDGDITVDTYENLIIVRKTEMTALDVVRTARALEFALYDFYAVLLENYPQCDDCTEDCSFCEDYIEDSIVVPEWAKDVAGLPSDCKFRIIAEEDSERILLEPTDYDNDLTDIDERTREHLKRIGICLGDLNESIIGEEIIYND